MRGNRNANRADAARSGVWRSPSRLGNLALEVRRHLGTPAQATVGYDSSGDQAGSEAKLGVGTRC